MSGYVVADVTWANDDDRRQYIELLGPSLLEHGGEMVARIRDVEVMEGDWRPGDVTVLISFPSREAALTWYGSKEYRPALELRRRASTSRLMIFSD
ncbi:MAG: DUF1330 domain-containing protein [Acidimicrobiales bacterium]